VTDPRPIGVFDSGVGGLTVLTEILRRALDELAARDVKAIVVACNTSTAVALVDLRRRYDIPILGVIRPGASAAALATRSRRVGVIATPATVRSHAYFEAIKDENPAVEVYEHATPALVPLVEAGHVAGPEAEAAVSEALAPLLGTRDGVGEFIFPLPPSTAIDTLLLGCTHYPLLRPVIARQAGDGVAIVDSATATASALVELLSINGLEAPDGGPVARHRQLTTGDVDSFRAIAARLFGDAFADVDGIELGVRA